MNRKLEELVYVGKGLCYFSVEAKDLACGELISEKTLGKLLGYDNIEVLVEKYSAKTGYEFRKTEAGMKF